MGNEFKGIYAALVTPYKSDGSVNLAELKRLTRYLISKGIDGFYVGGSTGEAFLLTQEERKELLEAVLEENNGEKKVIAHVGQISTELACELARHGSRAGADAVSAISPFYYKFSEEEIKGYYRDIMEASTLPMFLYNFPNFSGFSLSPEILDDLCGWGNVAGVKFTSNNFFDMERMRTRHPELTIWNGFDEMLIAGLAVGADGAIGSTYNILCPIAKRVYESLKSGDLEKAREYQEMINQMVAISRNYSNIFGVIKAVLDMDGFSMGGCRKPFTLLPECAKKEIEQIYQMFVKPFA